MRTERITSRKVREAFQTLKDNADVVGFDTEGWDLIEPQFVGGYWCLVDRGPDGRAHKETPFKDPQLGVGSREVYTVLRAMNRSLYAVAHLLSEKNKVANGN